MKLDKIAANSMRGVALLLLTFAFLGDFLAPNPPGQQNLSHFYAPPTRIHFADTAGRVHLRPFVYRYELTNALEGSYQEQTETAYPLEFFANGWSYELFGFIPASRHLVRSRGGALYLLGTDELGRDVAARALAGTRTSLIVMLLGISLYAALGIAIGAAAGLGGGWRDTWLMRFAEFVLALPALYIILALRALLPLKLPYWQTLFVSVGTISVIAWPPLARGVRGLILQLRSAEYVEAARSLGGTPWQVFGRHMLPALAPYILTQTALAAPVFVLGEILLSFLGFGFQEGAESWGSMLRSVTDLRVLTNFWWNLAPLFFVFAALLCLNVSSNRYRSKELDRVTL
jgi:peptide/nickel transport system permease protein